MDIESINKQIQTEKDSYNRAKNRLQQKLLTLKKDYEREGFHLQRLYKRRLRDKNGIMRSTFGQIMEEIPEGRQNLRW